MNKNHFDFALLFVLTVSIISIITAQSSPPCIQSCPGSNSPNHLPFPFGFSDGCQIRLNCTKKGEVLIGEFQVQNLTSENLIIKIQPKCNRSIQSLIPLFNQNFAIAWQNGLLLQNCSSSPRGCVIPEALLGTQFDFKNCGRPSCFSSMNEKENSSFMTLDYVIQSSCKFIYSSTAVLNSSSSVELEFQMLRLGWWLEGTCNCSSNAVCTEVISPVNFRRGYRCRCSEGYQGDGFLAGRGCSKDLTRSYRPLLSKGGLSVGVSVAAVAFALFLAICLYVRLSRRKMMKKTSLLSAEYKDSDGAFTSTGLASSTSLVSPRLTGITVDKSVEFFYEELARATDDFSLVNKIGQGGFGTVYYAELRGEKAAIKKMEMQASKEFLAELKVLTRVHHLNLVRLIGYCVEGSLCLVYEFIDSGNLSEHLRGSAKEPLAWSTRVQIAFDSARGLEYIHEHTVPVYIHRDIKSANILIDRNFRGKVADFGLTKLTEVGSGSLQTRVVGTFGYMPPEYAQYGEITPKVDVYAFGVVLYELISAKEAVVRTNESNHELRGLVAMFEEALNQPDPKDDLCKLVDPRLGDNYSLDSVLKMAQLAKACTQETPQLRPSMRSIVVALMTLSSTTEDWDAAAFYENPGLVNLMSGR